MKKIIIPFLVLILFSSAIFAANPEDTGQKGAGQSETGIVESPGVEEAGQGTGQGQQTQTEQETQNRGEEQQIQTREEAQVQKREETSQESGEQTFILEGPKKARTMNEAKEMVQQKQQEMTQELQGLNKVQQKVYQNQNRVREAVHALLSIEDLATGIGPQISQIAREFNNSVQATLIAEEKIQKRSAFARFFIGGEKNAAEEMEREVNQNQQRVQELKQLREECDCGEEVKTMMQEQIQKMEQEQERLQQLADKERKAQGIFGWVRNLFKWGR